MYSFGFIIDMQIGIAVLYLLYRLLLSGRIPLYACRAYLLLIAPAAAAVAWVKLPVLSPLMIDSIQVESASFELQIVEPTIAHVESFDYLFWFYVLGVAICAFWSLIGLIRIGTIAARNHKQGGVYFCQGGVNSCSFFSLIFIDERYRTCDAIEAIIAHETIHSRYLHSLDLLYINALRALLWFNPVVWLIGRSLGEVHECQADRRVMDLGFSPIHYIETLLAAEIGFIPSSVVPNSLTHSFSYSLTKNRIKMITKFNTRLSTLRLLALLPVLSAMLCMMSFTRPVIENTPNQDAQPTTVQQKTSTTSDAKPTHPTVKTPQKESIKVLKKSSDEALEKVHAHTAIIKSDGVTTLTRSSIAASGVMIVIDGKVSDSTYLQKISPESIHTITVLKDEVAVRIYGEKAKNGVIMVETKNAVKDPTLFTAEEMPRFQGSDISAFRQWVNKNLVYPEEAFKKGLSGRVTIDFTIETDGQVSEVKVVRSANALLDSAAVSTVRKSPRWEPGKNHGEPVRMKYIIPVDFSLK